MKPRIFLLISMSFILAACSPSSTATRVPVVSTETTKTSVATTPPDKPIEVEAGKEFNIMVKSNPSTGYHWGLIGDLDPNIMKFISKDYKADEPVLIGSGGVDILVFKAIAAGETTITLGYYPPSNDVVQPAQTLTFTVIIK